MEYVLALNHASIQLMCLLTREYSLSSATCIYYQDIAESTGEKPLQYNNYIHEHEFLLQMETITNLVNGLTGLCHFLEIQKGM